MKHFLLFTAISLCSIAQANDSIYRIFSGNLMEYPYSQTVPPAQTPAPEGYTPFHMEHYGRHGSRWLIGANDYNIPVERLERAERNNMLTPLGVRTLNALREIREASQNRWGELSDKGAAQHRTIGRRMASNFPEIFAPGANVDAKSTVVIRCILSMLNGIEGIRSVQPDINLHSDASFADMYFMNFDDKSAWPVKDRADSVHNRPYKERNRLKGDYLSKLIADEEFARDSVEPGLMPYLYWVLANAQSHSGQPFLTPEIFSEEEMKQLWRADNGGWIIHSINSPMSENRMPFTQRNLLRNMIESTDTALVSQTPGANLRYGHDGILLNLITLMDLNGLGREFQSIEEAEEAGVRSYELIPMAGNLQMILYRPDIPNKEWLVKILLNEREVTLPVPSDTAPYYSWPALRAHYLSRLADFRQ